MDLTKELNEIKEKVTPINTAKFLVGTLISCGAMAAIVAALKNPIQSAKGITKLMMRLGIFVLGCKAGDVAEQYFSEKVDEAVKAYKDATKEETPNESAANKQ